jgi:hypothetical protein
MVISHNAVNGNGKLSAQDIAGLEFTPSSLTTRFGN